jgi:hypothetical protein
VKAENGNKNSLVAERKMNYENGNKEKDQSGI